MSSRKMLKTSQSKDFNEHILNGIFQGGKTRVFFLMVAQIDDL